MHDKAVKILLRPEEMAVHVVQRKKIKQAPQGFEALSTHSKDNNEGQKKVKVVPNNTVNQIRVFKEGAGWPKLSIKRPRYLTKYKAVALMLITINGLWIHNAHLVAEVMVDFCKRVSEMAIGTIFTEWFKFREYYLGGDRLLQMDQEEIGICYGKFIDNISRRKGWCGGNSIFRRRHTWYSTVIPWCCVTRSSCVVSHESCTVCCSMRLYCYRKWLWQRHNHVISATEQWPSAEFGHRNKIWWVNALSARTFSRKEAKHLRFESITTHVGDCCWVSCWIRCHVSRFLG